MEGQVCDGGLVAVEVSDEGVVVRREVSNRIYSQSASVAGPGCTWRRGRRTVRFCARIDNAGAGVGELGQLDAVLFAEKGLVMSSVFDVVDLNGLVALRCHTKVARVVKVDGQDRGLRFSFLDVLSLE